MKTKITALLLALVMVFAMTTVAFAADTGAKLTVTTEVGDGLVKATVVCNPFTDIDNHWAKENILKAYYAGLFKGVSDTTFYSYDQDNGRWISFSKDDPTDFKVEREDAEGESRIYASTLVNDTIYAFDEHLCFYTIDPDTFERTLVTDAYKDMTYSYYLGGVGSFDLTLMPIDLSYDESTGRLYVAFVGYEVGMYGQEGHISGLCSLFYEGNMETGELGRNGNGMPSFRDDTVHVGNLLAENSKLYFVDAFTSGMFRYADLNRWQTNQDALIVEYWGLFYHGRGMVRDEYTGEVYAIYDKDPEPRRDDPGHCRLVSLTLNNPDATFCGGFIAEGSVLNSLFIR